MWDQCCNFKRVLSDKDTSQQSSCGGLLGETEHKETEGEMASGDRRNKRDRETERGTDRETDRDRR